MAIDPYKNYTRTSALPQGFDPKSIDWTRRYVETHFLPHFPTDKSIKILEIGCGWGKYLQVLNDLGYHNVTGIDISDEQITFAKEKLSLKNVFCGDAIDFIRSSKEIYDVVIMADVVEHLDLDYALELGEMVYNALNSGGVYLMQVPNGLSPLNPIRYADITHQRSFTVPSSTQYFKLIGFSQIEHTPLYPVIHGLKSQVRNLLWKFWLNPAIKAYMLVANGDTMGGIYTANLLTVGKK